MRKIFIRKANDQIIEKILKHTDEGFVASVVSLIGRLKDSDNLDCIEEPILDKLVEETKATDDLVLQRLVADLLTSIAHAGAKTLDELLGFAPNYVPSLRNLGKVEAFIADEYDRSMVKVGSEIRSF